MKIIKKALKKCCHRAQSGKPVVACGCEAASVPGYRLMNRWTAGSLRDPSRGHEDQEDDEADRQQP
jgi:hypothetical protein